MEDDPETFADHVFNHTRKLVTSFLALVVLGSVLGREASHSAAIIVLCTLATVILLLSYYNIDATRPGTGITSLVPAAVALEALLLLWARTVIWAQLTVSFIVGLLLYTAKPPPFRKEDDTAQWIALRHTAYQRAKDRGTLFSYLDRARLIVLTSVTMIWHHPRSILYVEDNYDKITWVAARTFILVVSYADGNEELWLIAQLVLVICIAALASDVFPVQPETATLRKAWVAAGSIAVATILYTIDGVLPWGISIVLMVIPVVYIVNDSIPSAYAEMDDHHIRAGTAIVAVICAIAAFGYPRGSDNGGNGGDNTTAVEAVSYSVVSKTGCPAHRNQKECDIGADTRWTIGTCCCTKGYVPYRAYGCIPAICTASVSNPHDKVFRDCCSHALTAAAQNLLCGKYLCACSNTPSHPTRHSVDHEAGKCVCAAGYSGVYCEHGPS